MVCFEKESKIKQFYHNWIRSVAMFSFLLYYSLEPPYLFLVCGCVYRQFRFHFFFSSSSVALLSSTHSFPTIKIMYFVPNWITVTFYGLKISWHTRQWEEKNNVFSTQPVNSNNMNAKPTKEHMYIQKEDIQMRK